MNKSIQLVFALLVLGPLHRLQKSIFLTTGFLVCCLTLSAAQDCVDLPTGNTWHGKTLNGIKDYFGDKDSISVVKVDELTFTVSDFSAGFFDEIAFTGDFSVKIQLNCAGEVISNTSFETPIGDGNIIEGSWNSTSKILLLKWEIPLNNITETSQFEVQ